MDPFLDMEAILRFGEKTGVHDIMLSAWGWPIVEILHYSGLTLLFGTVGLYDLRVMGLAKSLAPGALHRLIPLGVTGFAVNLITGSMLYVTQPELYTYNPAFQLKVLAVAVAGINMVLFYSFLARRTHAVGPGEDAPLGARIAAGVSFFAWLAVAACGRFIGFFKPPEFWCLWCGPPA